MASLRVFVGVVTSAVGLLVMSGSCGSEFSAGEDIGGAGGAGGSPGSGGAGSCSAPEDCPGQDLSCAKRSCDAGACGVVNVPLGEPTAEQYVGDCQTMRCNGQGSAIPEPDSDGAADADIFDDGNPCTEDLCVAGEPTNEANVGAPCPLPDGGNGFCAQSAACVECISETDCPTPGDICIQSLCVPASCDNGTTDGDETAEDCGGPDCAPCADNLPCDQDSDCQSGVCDGTCQAPSCSDDTSNGQETGVDCGGATSGCDACPPGQACGVPADCISGVCIGGKCKANTCTDGVQNGNETAQDCGGMKCPGCADGLHCNNDDDCQSGYCGAGQVCANRCTNQVKDGQETDTDCGGPQCTQCGNGEVCKCNNDCKSAVCCYSISGSVNVGQCIEDASTCDGTTMSICGVN